MKFSKKYSIDYLNLKPDAKATFVKLMEKVQQCSLDHTEYAGYPMKYFIENGTGWVITNWQVEVYDYPYFSDIVNVETWISRRSGFASERSFHLCDEKNNVILKANSFWIYTDLNERKPIKPDTELIEGYGKIFESALKKDFKIPMYDRFELLKENEITVKRSDTDTNIHVNNIKYLEWMQDNVPDEFYYNKSIKHMKATYRKECSLNETVYIETYKKRDNDNEILTLIKKQDRETSDKIVASEIYTEWR